MQASRRASTRALCAHLHLTRNLLKTRDSINPRTQFNVHIWNETNTVYSIHWNVDSRMSAWSQNSRTLLGVEREPNARSTSVNARSTSANASANANGERKRAKTTSCKCNQFHRCLHANLIIVLFGRTVNVNTSNYNITHINYGFFMLYIIIFGFHFLKIFFWLFILIFFVLVHAFSISYKTRVHV